ncbi:carboxypeptidase regulatory-like domain-containing protein [Bartonella sp. TP]|uniref:carboxypeptidase regulatory-like domain-containing protein n=1 Tax=Bartonella sp. TP TaxID=3057550 RepID=UPI0025B1C627|nr:carboxypeptidase regulatory-like domain-containing protein [Bartonella sp. TP]MDN5248765.1 carboxypeptidase regulatory-like domain-containing protein [Alphaproteobacteria bacterium]WJW79998.1 carboxypeptidase regulatory-like domain-containing protein [Bartonella sp. TP]
MRLRYFSRLLLIFLVFVPQLAQAAFVPANALKPNLLTSAVLHKNGEIVKSGLVWRIYITVPIKGATAKVKKDSTNQDDQELKQVQSSANPQGQFALPPGFYYVQCNFGRISVIDTVTVPATGVAKLQLNLDAGGVQLDAQVKDGQIEKEKLHFAIYANDTESDDAALILPNIKPNMLVRLKAGTYHIVCYYGRVNATERANVKIAAGRISHVAFKQKAAKITLRLLREENGGALANTKWSIADASGDVVYEATDAYLSVILAKGHYVAIARNNGTFQKDFTVESGQNTNVDVLTVQKPPEKHVNNADDWATD